MSESAAATNSCPKCGATLPLAATGGLCPRCLMAEAMVPTQADPDAGTPPQTLTPAEIAPFFPQLEILEFLGRGGMGVVYQTRQKSLNRLAALKLLAPERVQDARFAERFAREARALAALSHPSIVTIYDFGQAGGFYYLLMEFVDGLNLRQLLRTRRFTPQEALAIVPPLCEALQFAHDRGIVHRDIKPENLLLDKAGRVKIADFGIAKILGSGDGTSLPGEPVSSENITQTTLGTPSYSAPEQKTDPQHVDSRADIYSLGVVFYEMLTGELPNGKFVPPSKRVRIDVRLDEVVLRALEKNPDLRYQQVSALKTRVETIVATAENLGTANDKTNPMSEFKFYCQHCGQPILSDTNHAGLPVNCPACQRAILVPQTPVATPASPLSTPANPMPPGAAAAGTRPPAGTPLGTQSATARTNPLQYLLIAAVVALFLACIGLVGWYVYSHHARLMTGPQPSDLVASWTGADFANGSDDGHNGKLVNDVEVAPGRNGPSFSFQPGGYILVPGSPDLDVGKGKGFTIAAWINPDTTSRQMPIAEFERALGSRDGSDVGIQFYINLPPDGGTGPGCFFANIVESGGHVSHIINSPPGLVTAGTWQHVALSYDQASGLAKIYLNGSVVSQKNLGSFIPETSYTYLLIGARTAYGAAERPSDQYSGSINDVNFYKRALSDSEIRFLSGK